ncbi:MAG: CRISPR-associated protein (Cas_Csd1) [Candidatus Omnitrophica bacterium ADurb.Bin292]|nr:MAG: CRISPR-associated protein (Cas_Csd1) [Candidatus Omnitrophica bacterium ADurb.Bin292]HQB12000.1 type I-C CRISPR-associated protein Cas8c/Csd1 [Candidatus Omnitrophota bacterium]
MILQSLYELYDRLSGLADNPYEISPFGYSLQKIAFRLVITNDGRLHELESLRDPQTNLPKQMIVPGGDKPTGKVTERSAHKKTQFLRNNLSFLLGISVEGDKNPALALAQMEFEAFKKVHLEREQQINDPDYSVFCKFLRHWKPEAGLAHGDWIAFGDGQGVIKLIGKTEYLHDRPAVRAWWDENQPKNKSKPVQCLITGDLKPASRLHEPKIRSVKDSQPAGAPIVSFDKGSDAFSSYGHDGEQGLNAPVSEEATFRYATALNSLLAGPQSWKHRFTLGDTTVVFWTDKPSDAEDIFAQFAKEGSTVPKKEEVQDEALLQKMQIFLKVLREGRQAYTEIDKNPDQTNFFILGMTGQARGRIGVRFFYKDTVGHLLDNLRKHYNDMKIIRQYEEGAKYPDSEFPPTWLLLRQTARDKDDIPPILSGPLLRAVITGSLYPEGLYKAVIRRVHADREINYLRTSVIKGYLVRNQKQEVSMSLDPGRKDPAYRIGRLFSALEKTQTDALGEVGSSIKDRFYSAASAMPRSVFPRLLRLYSHHLGKLSVGMRVNREKLVQEIMCEIHEFPGHMNLSDQGLFAIGYYHQMCDFYRGKKVE